jgi:hypothetical protein
MLVAMEEVMEAAKCLWKVVDTDILEKLCEPVGKLAGSSCCYHRVRTQSDLHSLTRHGPVPCSAVR